jgi:L-lactate dehydrogenase complex protein LldG
MAKTERKKMSSRETILNAIERNKPTPAPLPDLSRLETTEADLLKRFTTVAVGIGSKVFEVADYSQIEALLQKQFSESKRIISMVPTLQTFTENQELLSADPHALENVDLAVLEASLAVAENSAIWISEEQAGQRVLPFICQHLSIIIRQEDIVADMHKAYKKMESNAYGYGVFIAGPSKTADIEQSLVLGAHGPRSLSIFILRKDPEEMKEVQLAEKREK